VCTSGTCDRNVYWPGGAPGTLHMRFFATVSNNGSLTAPLALSIGLESWREDINGTYQPQFPRCTATAPLQIWSMVSVPLWMGGGLSDVSWLVARLSLTGFAEPGAARATAGRAFLDRLEVTAPGAVPDWQVGLPVVHC
jgi:hypothetical protein